MKKLSIVALIALSACKTIEYQGAAPIAGTENDIMTFAIKADDSVNAASKSGEYFTGQLQHEQKEICPTLSDIMLNTAIGAAFDSDSFADENNQCQVDYTGKSTLNMQGTQGNSLQCIFQAEEGEHFPDFGEGVCIYPDGRQMNVSANNFRMVEVEN